MQELIFWYAFHFVHRSPTWATAQPHTWNFTQFLLHEALQQSNARSYITSSLSEASSLNQFKRLWAWSWYKKNAYHVPANPILRRQNLWMTVTSFLAHTQHKNLKFQKQHSVLWLKWSFPHLSVYICLQFLVRTVHASCIWLLCFQHEAARSMTASIWMGCKSITGSSPE